MLVGLSALTVWVLGREATLMFVANKVIERSGGKLQLSEVRGSLLSTVRVGQIRLEGDFGRLAVSDAHLGWKPLRLFLGQMAVKDAVAGEVALELAQKKDEPKKPPESLASPVSFSVEDFQIQRLTITQAGSTQEIRGIRAAFAGNKRGLEAELKSLAAQWGNVTARVKVGATSPFPLDGAIELVSLDPQKYGAIAMLGGTLLETEAAVDARAGRGSATAKLAVAPFEVQPLTSLALSAKDFDPREWVPTAPGAQIGGEVNVTAGAERRLNGTVVLVNAQPGTIDEQKIPFARLGATLHGNLTRLALEDLKLDLAQAGQFSGAGTWREGGLQTKLATSNFNLRGVQKRLNQTQLAGHLAVDVDSAAQRVRFNLEQQKYRFSIAAALSKGVVRFDEAYARAGNAELSTRGQIALDANKTFAVAGQLRNFDPAQFGKYASQRINSRFELKGQVEPVLQVAANATLADSQLFGLPASGSGTFRSRNTDRPDVAMDVSMRVGNTRATAKGTIQDAAKIGSIDMQLTLAGGSLDELYKIIGVPLPPTPQYRINGRLLHSGQVWELRQFAGEVGGSDLSGDFLINRGPTPQFMKANLTSNRLELADLAGFIGAEKTETGKVTTPNPGRVLPDSPYNLEKLKSADADVRFSGKRIVTERLPVENMTAHLIVKNGVLTLAPLNFGAAGGTIVSNITLDGSGQLIASRADIRVAGLQLSQIMPKLKVSQASVGELDGRVRLTARGNSIAHMLASANGDSSLVVGEGEVSDLIMRLANLDVANTLAVLVRGDKKIQLRCAVADLAFESGVMRPRHFIFDTAHTTLVGEGAVNFADESLRLRIVAKPKDRSILALRGPINVGGTFSKPRVLPDMKQLAVRGVAATALAVVAAPLAAIAPFIQLGEKSAVQCGPLVQTAKQQIHAPAAEVAQRRTPSG